MKNITKESLKDDLMIISEMFNEYSEAVYEGQCNQKAHYDNQPKLIKLAMEDVRCQMWVSYCKKCIKYVKRNFRYFNRRLI